LPHPIVFPNDDRAKLTWRGRFSNATPILYNFWSSGDEVLEIAEEEIGAVSGLEFDWELSWNPLNWLTINKRRYAWHKQALLKGRGIIVATQWAGWGFWEEYWWPFNSNVYTMTQANALDDATLRTAPVFRHYPENNNGKNMFTNSIPQTLQNEILARGIPELSYNIGYTNLATTLNAIGPDRHFDMHTSTDIRRTDGAWPQRDVVFSGSNNSRPKRWLHTDLMNVSYFHTYKLFDLIINKGNMK